MNSQLIPRHQHVGFTATRDGLSPQQLSVAHQGLSSQRSQGVRVAHAGDCVGGDDELQALAHELGLWVVVHPPSNTKLRAYGYYDELRWPKRYDVRNQDIVDEAGTLVAFPNSAREQLRSGTWQTVRMGRRAALCVVVVTPSGRVFDSAKTAVAS